MNREHWLLLATKFAEQAGLSPVQLQKVLFLLGKEMPGAVQDGFYCFVPHNYGPFSKEVYRDAEVLSNEGLLAVSKRGKYPEYFCTAAGEGIIDMVLPTADKNGVDYLHKVVEWAMTQSFAGLVRAIYRKYPDYRVNSVFSE